jgi:hypothetical protein
LFDNEIAHATRAPKYHRDTLPDRTRRVTQSHARNLPKVVADQRPARGFRIVVTESGLNKGLWNKMEYQIGRCMSAGYTTTYTVLNRYPYFSSTVRPSKFFVLVGVAKERCFGIFCFPVTFYRDSIAIPNEMPTSDTAFNVTGFSLNLAHAYSRGI